MLQVAKMVQYHWPEFYCGRERLLLCYGENQQETLSATEIVVSDSRIVFLPSRVQNINLYLFSIQHHFLPVAVGLCGLIIFNKLRDRK